MTNLPKTITFPQFPSITAYDDDDGEELKNLFTGDIAEQYLRKFATVSGADKTFGLRDKDGKFYIGNKEAKNKIKQYNCWQQRIRRHTWTMGTYCGKICR